MRHGEFGGVPSPGFKSHYVLGCCPCLPGGLGPPVAELAGLGPGCKSSLRFGPMRSQEPARVPGSVLGLSVRLPQDCKPPGRGGGRKYLNCVGLFLGTFLPSLPPSFRPPPSSLLSLTHSFIQQKFRLSPLGPALDWAMPGTGDDSNWCLPLGCSRAG